MLLAYVDESYTKDLYWIAALVVPDREAASLTASLDAVVRKAHDSYPSVSPRAELHGHAIFQAADDWASLALMPRARIGIYNDAFAAIAAHDVQIIIRGVDVRRLRERYTYPDPPHAVVLSHALERLDEYAASVPDWLLVIADEIQNSDDYRQNLWRFQRFSTEGYRARQLTRILDTMHFAPSQASRLVQAADLIVYLYQRIMSNLDRDARAIRANHALWDRLAPKVWHCWCWTP